MRKLTLIIAMAIRVPHCQSQDVIFGIFVNYKPHLPNCYLRISFTKVSGRITLLNGNASLNKGAICDGLNPAIPQAIGVTRNVNA